ncbi:hypothetical protein BGZ52_004394 [Haplosporangium bisporale]|nr:hypothetical protein BGZ52_004394 [Haplosporangium bisporale]
MESFKVLASCLEQELIFGGESKPKEYSGGDLVWHFLKRCLHALMQYKMYHGHVKSAAMFSVVLEARLRVSTLTVNGSTSNNLVSLTFHIGRLQDVKKSSAKIDIAARLRHINFRKLETDGFNVSNLSWIWRACGHVEELEVSRLSDDAILSVILDSKEFAVGVVQNKSDVLRVLKSCPNLGKLTALDDEGYWSNSSPEARVLDFIDWDSESSCVHWTLATGLGKFERLWELEELPIPNMNHQIKDVLEVEWMVENWPKLWKIIGLNQEPHVYKWLKAKHPDIRLKEPSSG